MGKQPGRHTDRLCNRRVLSVAAGAADRDRADIGGRCQGRDTVSPEAGTRFEEIGKHP